MAAIGCALTSTTVGPVTIDVPEGWHIADREASSVKLTDGSLGDETGIRPGTATAVFDIFAESRHTSETFNTYLLEQNVGASREELTVDGYEVVILSYQGAAFAGKQEAAFVDAWKIHAIYRAAFPNDVSAFGRGRTAFREAIGSMRFEATPPA